MTKMVLQHSWKVCAFFNNNSGKIGSPSGKLEPYHTIPYTKINFRYIKMSNIK